MTLIWLDPCQWSLMILITGNKVKKTHKPRYCEKGIMHGIFLSKTLNVLQSLKYIFWSTKC